MFYEQKTEFGQKIDKKENPGFDCVIGNPPYGAPFDTHEKNFFNKKYGAAEYQLESFTLFIEQALSFLRQNGFHSYITPTTWLSMHYYENLRSFLINNNQLQQVIIFKEPVFEDATVETCIELVKKSQPDKKSILMLGVVPDKPENLDVNWVELRHKKIQNFEGKRITEYLTPQLLDLFERIRKISLPLKDISLMVVGCKPYQVGKGTPSQNRAIVEDRLYDADFKKDNTYKQYIRGEDFYKYSLNLQEKRWISYGNWLAEPRPSAPFFVSKKIVIRQTADTLIATIEDKQFLNLNNVHNLVLKSENYSLEFILSILNSNLLSFIHRMIVPEFRRVFAEVKIVNLEKLPIPRISFTTPQKERKEFFKEAVKLYKGSKFENILKWAEYELALKRNDSVHDFLAYLAEQMIELNKAKNEEIKGFLRWLEREIGAEVDTLTNKTAIKEYHDKDFNSLLDVLKKNKNKLSINPSDRKTQELFEKHFRKSMSVLEPLKERIKATDSLIDQIVYKLYGLTDEEIELVEGKG